MKKKSCLSLLLCAFLICLISANYSCYRENDQKLENNIHHSAFFKLKDSLSSSDKELFFAEINKLAAIEGVIDFKVVIETSPKNNFTNGVRMEFVDQKAYDSYNSNPQHQKFVQEIWLKMVEDFMEIDYVYNASIK
jgi:hypothetical protein